MIAPTELRDKAALLAALAGDGVTFIDMKAESDGMVAAYTVNAWHWLAYGALGAALALLAGLRDIGRACRVAGSVLAAALVTVALLTALGTRLSLIHIVSLQLVAGVGLDYALFFARRLVDDEERARTLRTLVTCNAMTLLTFGLLALCRTPLLADIGVDGGAGGARRHGVLIPVRRPAGSWTRSGDGLTAQADDRRPSTSPPPPW